MNNYFKCKTLDINFMSKYVRFGCEFYMDLSFSISTRRLICLITRDLHQRRISFNNLQIYYADKINKLAN